MDPDPNNWASDQTVRLGLIDPAADIAHPANLTEADYLIIDIREAQGQTTISWYVEAEIGAASNPAAAGYYPLLTCAPNEFGCSKIGSKDYVYQLLQGLGTGGTVLVADMAATASYQTKSYDGNLVQHFTILWREKPQPAPTKPTKPSLPSCLFGGLDGFPWAVSQ